MIHSPPKAFKIVMTSVLNKKRVMGLNEGGPLNLFSLSVVFYTFISLLGFFAKTKDIKHAIRKRQ